MKRILIRLLCITICFAWLTAMGQSREQDIPPFRIALTDSTYFNRADLKANLPLVLVYFSPGCDHCNDFVRDMLREYASFKMVQVVFISNEPLPAVKKFEEMFGLSKYKNIKTGTEGSTFKMQRYFQINRFPFVAVFDKSRKQLAIFREDPNCKKICRLLATCHSNELKTVF